MAVVEISVVPLGTGTTSVSKYVAACIDIVASSNLSYQLTPMGTVIEGDIDDILPVLREMHEIPFNKGAQRVSTLIKIDDRRDSQNHGLKGKVDSVINQMKTGI